MGLGAMVFFIAGYGYRVYTAPPETKLLREAYELLENHGYDPLPEAPTLEYGMIRGMLEAYGDRYTIFVEPVQHELQSNNLSGEFGGIGAQVSRDEAGEFILHPLPDSPSELAGVQDGDRLRGVDGTAVTTETSMDDMLARVRGPVGEEVTIEVARPPEMDMHDFVIVRESFTLPSVSWYLAPDEPRLGVMQVNMMSDSTADEIAAAYEALKADGAEYFALDLRNNLGGLLDAGVEAAQLFLEEGAIMEQQYRGQAVKQYEADEAGPLADIPLVVLVNEYTASAAEILAGALQAKGRALLIGTTTFGKDSVQLVFELSDGSSVHVTAAKWWLPQVDFPGEVGGLTPDVWVQAGEGPQDAWLREAVEVLGIADL